MSYDGTLGIGAIGCPDTVPEVEEIPRAFEASVDELLHVAHQAAAAA
jgi:hypothetical protein